MRPIAPSMKIMTVAVAAATRSTALALQQPTQQQSRFVYKLGNSLYVPLTSRCNSLTLPQLRGDGFSLPKSVVVALCNVRDAELRNYHEGMDVNVGMDVGIDDVKWFNDPNTNNGESSNCQNSDDDLTLKMKLPPPPFEAVASLPPWNNDDGILFELSREQREPKLDDLLREIQHEFRETNNNIESIVIAGEGEPTLRLKDTIELARRIKKSFANNTLPASSQAAKPPPAIRLTTNGLVPPLAFEFELEPELESSAPGVSSVPQTLWDSGVSRISVGLMTWNAKQYHDLVKPVVVPETEITGFDTVCNFVRDAVTVDGELEVEITAVDRPDVDKTKTEALAESLGVTTPVRWRPYFP
jgi:hypothetical protein